MGLSVHARPVGEVVVVAVEVVDEPAFLDDQLARVDAHLAAVPAQRPLTDSLLDRRDGALDRLALLVAGHLEVVHPPVAVTGDLVATLGQLLRDRDVPLESHRGRDTGHIDAGVGEDPELAPDPGARAIFVGGLDGQVAHAFLLVRQLVQVLVEVIAHGVRLLGTLFIVEDDLDRDLRPAWPADLGRVLAVADQLSRRTGHPGNVGRPVPLLVKACRHRGSLLINVVVRSRSGPAPFPRTRLCDQRSKVNCW